MTLNILIVSTQIFCERLKMAMKDFADRLYDGRVVIKVTDSAEYLRRRMPSELTSLEDIETNTIDYVFVVLDGHQLKNEVKYHNILENLMPHYVATRVTLVNGTCRSASNAFVVAQDMTGLADDYNISYVNAEIMDDESCTRTAERLLRMAAIASGYAFGTPIPIPTPADIGLLPPRQDLTDN